jgi:hypothetical protein
MTLLALLTKGRDALSTAAQKLFPPLGCDAAWLAELGAPDDAASDATVLFEFGWTGAPVPRRAKALSVLLTDQVQGSTARILICLPIVLGGRAVGLSLLSVTAFDREMLQEVSDTLAMLLAMRAGAPR